MNAIKHARSSRGLTLSEAAALFGTDAGNLSRIERGVQIPKLSMARKIAAEFGLTLDQVFEAAQTVDEEAA